jgi:hypothetical protein
MEGEEEGTSIVQKDGEGVSRWGKNTKKERNVQKKSRA